MKKNELLLKNRELFARMNEIMKKQEEAASADNINDFLELSQKRERLQKNISSNIKENKKEAENEAREEAGKKYKRLGDEISEIIDSIRESDRRIEEILFIKRNILLKEIKGFRKSQNALKGYQRNRCKNPRFL